VVVVHPVEQNALLVLFALRQEFLGNQGAHDFECRLTIKLSLSPENELEQRFRVLMQQWLRPSCPKGVQDLQAPENPSRELDWRERGEGSNQHIVLQSQKEWFCELIGSSETVERPAKTARPA
jgi:hypothetical protein